MQRFFSKLNSRTWSLVVLTGGAALALPFFRLGDTLDPNDALKSPNATSDADSTIVPLGDVTRAAQLASTQSPATDSTLPPWVASGPPPMQKLLRETKTTSDDAPAQAANHLPMQPLRPWTDEPLRTLSIDRSSAAWPDQGIETEELDQLVQNRQSKSSSGSRTQLEASPNIAHADNPLQPASLARPTENLRQSTTNAVKTEPAQDRLRYFIFQPGMRNTTHGANPL